MSNTYKGPDRDEFTAKMHEELYIDEETALKHRVWDALTMITDFSWTRQKALEQYHLTEKDMDKYSAHWFEIGRKKLND